MVLAAGRGERMRPLSQVLPKPALPLIHQPVIASGIKLAAATGAGRVVVNTWHLADAMEQKLTEIEAPVPITISRETELMGTAGGIALARDRGLLGDCGPVLVINGDGLLNLDLDPLYHRMRTSDDLVSLALLPHLDPLRWSRIALDQSGLVTSIKKPGAPETGEAPFLYPGVMLISREALDRLSTGPGDTPGRLWGPAMIEGRLGGVLVAGHWREIGTPTDYLDAVLGRINREVVVHPTADVHPSARVQSSMIGQNSTIEAGAVVGDSIVAEGARVKSNARVLRSVLLGSISAEAEDTVIDQFLAEPFG
jgi:mannose-1-phosphate guanylyltransferase